MNLVLSPSMADQLRCLYDEMEAAYDLVASQLGHTCNGCPDNCCDSYFLHHTYIEWAYLRMGIETLPTDKQEEIVIRADAYERIAAAALNRGERPQIMCPLNESGRCILYHYRLMVCRTHGVPATMIRPDGRILRFPGCFRCQQLVEQNYPTPQKTPYMERTELLKRLVVLEQSFLDNKRQVLPRVKKTIAGMITDGAPVLGCCADTATADRQRS